MERIDIIKEASEEEIKELKNVIMGLYNMYDIFYEKPIMTPIVAVLNSINSSDIMTRTNIKPHDILKVCIEFMNENDISDEHLFSHSVLSDIIRFNYNIRYVNKSNIEYSVTLVHMFKNNLGIINKFIELIPLQYIEKFADKLSNYLCFSKDYRNIEIRTNMALTIIELQKKIGDTKYDKLDNILNLSYSTNIDRAITINIICSIIDKLDDDYEVSKLSPLFKSMANIFIDSAISNKRNREEVIKRIKNYKTFKLVLEQMEKALPSCSNKTKLWQSSIIEKIL